MVREKLIFKVPVEVDDFHPSQLPNGRIYLRKDQATASSWASTLGFLTDFTQTVATSQPTINANSVDFDGVNDVMIAANPFSSYTEASIFGSGYKTAGVNDFPFAISQFGVNDFYFLVGSRNTDKFTVAMKRGVGADVIDTVASVPDGYYTWAVICEATGWKVYINGVLQAVTVVSGTNTGEFSGAYPLMDRAVLSGLSRLTPSFFTSSMNKLFISTDVLTSDQIDDMNTFMSVPTNY